MDILQAFILNGTEHNVTILWENNKPLFRASEIGHIIEIKDINSSIKTFDEDEKVKDNILTLGGKQEVLFLTESGVYRLLMNSRKPIAKPFQKWVSKVIESIRETGKYELQIKLIETEERMRAETKEQIRLALDEEYIKNTLLVEKSEHNALVQAFTNRSVVYFGKIYDKNGKSLIKIGSTKELNIRSSTLIKEYDSFMIFKVFECPMNESFEKFLHHHENIKIYKYTDDNYYSTETFLVTKEEIYDIVNIAKHNKFKFISIIESQHIIELKNIKLQQIQARVEELKFQNYLAIKEDIKDKTYIDPIIILTDSRKHTQSKGNKIQRYSQDGQNLIFTYESYAYAMRDTSLLNITRSCLKNAIKNNTIYKDFRWMELDRSMPDNTIQILEKTLESHIIKIGYIAMLNLDKNKIEHVFCDQKAAAEHRKFNSSASISNAIKRNSISSGHYFMMWYNCEQELQNEYLKNNLLPQKRAAINNKQIEQLHPITECIIKYYSSIEDVIKEFKISRQTLKSACDFNIISKGYKWKII